MVRVRKRSKGPGKGTPGKGAPSKGAPSKGPQGKGIGKGKGGAPKAPKKHKYMEHLSDGFRERDSSTVSLGRLPEGLESKEQVGEALEEAFGKVLHIHIDANLKFGFAHFEEESSAMVAVEAESVEILGELVELRPPNASRGGAAANGEADLEDDDELEEVVPEEEDAEGGEEEDEADPDLLDDFFEERQGGEKAPNPMDEFFQGRSGSGDGGEGKGGRGGKESQGSVSQEKEAPGNSNSMEETVEAIRVACIDALEAAEEQRMMSCDLGQDSVVRDHKKVLPQGINLLEVLRGFPDNFEAEDKGDGQYLIILRSAEASVEAAKSASQVVARGLRKEAIVEKREEQCSDFKKGKCNRGSSCKFAHVGGEETHQAQGEMRPGDWICPSCSNHVFARKSVCGRCDAPKPEAAAGGDTRPGDWTCPSCNNLVFARKTVCGRCNKSKPEALDAGNMRPGDWICPSCSNHVYARKSICGRCNATKPEAHDTGDHAWGKGKGRGRQRSRSRSRSGRRGGQDRDSRRRASGESGGYDRSNREHNQPQRWRDEPAETRGRPPPPPPPEWERRGDWPSAPRTPPAHGPGPSHGHGHGYSHSGAPRTPPAQGNVAPRPRPTAKPSRAAHLAAAPAGAPAAPAAPSGGPGSRLASAARPPSARPPAAAARQPAAAARPPAAAARPPPARPSARGR